MARLINKNNFTTEVAESATLAIIQFKSEWNGSCQIIAPVIAELERYYTDAVNFFTNEIGTEASLETDFGIHELPTLLFFKDGKIIDHFIGLVSIKTLKAKIEEALLNFSNPENRLLTYKL